MKDWTGNGNSVFKNLASSNHCNEERESLDYYATDPSAVESLLKVEDFCDDIWECACGEGHIARVFEKYNFNVKCSDVVDRGYPNTEIIDFLKYNGSYDGDIVTNPPYKYALEFAQKAMNVLQDGCKLAMLLKIQFLETKKRAKFFEKYPLKHVHVFSDRIECGKNGIFIGAKAVCYAWFVWEKGFHGNTILRWL